MISKQEKNLAKTKITRLFRTNIKFFKDSIFLFLQVKYVSIFSELPELTMATPFVLNTQSCSPAHDLLSFPQLCLSMVSTLSGLVKRPFLPQSKQLPNTSFQDR